MKEKKKNPRQRLICLSLFIFNLFFFSGISIAQPDFTTPPYSSTEPEKTGEVCGQFMMKGGGLLAGGFVLFYNADLGPAPNISQYLRVPTVIGEILSNGTFCLDLPGGSYYFLAVKRNSGKKYGKPQKGDYWFRYKEEDGTTLKKISISEGEHIDFGVLEASPRLGKFVRPVAVNTIIEGSILDLAGRPVEKAVVFAFPTPEIRGQKPLYLSDPTGLDGKYTLRVAGGNIYYLVARDVLGGGRLAEGGIIGVYGGRDPKGFTVKKRETMKDMDIRVLMMGQRGPVQEEGITPEFDPNKKGSRKPFSLTSPLIESGQVQR